jgi:hypothetical protein
MESESNLKVLQCFDEGLNSIGTAGKQAVYWYLAQKLDLKREKIPDHPGEFLAALKSLFGQGAGILEKTIVRQLRQSFNITLGENMGEVLALIKGRDSPRIKGNHLRTRSAELSLED